jgi:hypothetical protein
VPGPSAIPQVSVESERVADFGHLEDGLRQAGEWYQWGPYVCPQTRRGAPKYHPAG